MINIRRINFLNTVFMLTIFYFTPTPFLYSENKINKDSEHFHLKKGDLLFQDLDTNRMCSAIETVTKGYKGANLSHVGIIDKNKKDKYYVIEALNKVHKVSLKKFLSRSKDKNGNPKVIVGRLQPRFRDLIPAALKEAHSLLGATYNKTFNIHNHHAFYCSQLIYYIFKKANNGQPIFKLHPMNFKNPETGKIYPVWKHYFQNLDAAVPQKKPGLNPGGLSRSKIINIVHYYGIPEGMQIQKDNPEMASFNYYDLNSN